MLAREKYDSTGMNELATALAKLKRMLVDETKEPRPFSNFHNLLTQTKIDAMKATRSKVKEVLARVGESAQACCHDGMLVGAFQRQARRAV